MDRISTDIPNNKKVIVPIGINVADHTPYRVVIAEDEPLSRVFIKRYFQYEHFNVAAEFERGNNIPKRLQDMPTKPHILCIDYSVSGGRGIEIIGLVKKAFPDIKTILVADEAERDMVMKVIDKRVDAVVIKPIVKKKFNDVLAQVMGRKDLLAQNAVVYKSGGINLKELKIPPMPTVLMKVIKFDTDQNVSGGSAELEKIIAPDKSISADIIRISNSAFYGRSKKISSLKDAITLIGMKTVKNLVFVQAQKNISKSLRGPYFRKHLQELPILSSLVAFDLLNPLGQEKFNPLKDTIFLANMFRRIGMTVLALNFTDKYQKILKLSEYGTKDTYQLEKEQFNTTSIEIGTKVFLFWKMPQDLMAIITNQNFSIQQIEKVRDIDRVSRLAEAFSKKMLQLRLTEKEVEVEDAILKFYGAPEELKELFGEDFYEMIQDHPFFDMIPK
ncbi:MAG: HDOD domain-containing protein [Spirochaetota bacterium]